jgi:hypothetical protein
MVHTASSRAQAPSTVSANISAGRTASQPAAPAIPNQASRSSAGTTIEQLTQVLTQQVSTQNTLFAQQAANQAELIATLRDTHQSQPADGAAVTTAIGTAVQRYEG